MEILKIWGGSLLFLSDLLRVGWTGVADGIVMGSEGGEQSGARSLVRPWVDILRTDSSRTRLGKLSMISLEVEMVWKGKMFSCNTTSQDIKTILEAISYNLDPLILGC